MKGVFTIMQRLASSDLRLVLHAEVLCIYLHAKALGMDLMVASCAMGDRRRAPLSKTAFGRRWRHLSRHP